MLLNPSVTEAFGNVTLEAMASALPVVAVESTGAINLVGKDRGVLTDPGDADAMADAVAGYAEDRDLWRRHRPADGRLHIGAAALAVS